jgi:tetratricopeptide (TPR) repeat protein
MRAVLNAMGATLWGAIAITLAVAVVALSHRASPRFFMQWPDTDATAPPRSGTLAREQADSGMGHASTGRVSGAPSAPPTMALRLAEDHTGPMAAPRAPPDEPALIGHYLEPRHSAPQIISRVIAKPMRAAQTALHMQQWAEALENLQAAEQQSGLTAFDEKTIYNFKGYADIKLHRLADAQTEFQKALATGDATPEETAQMTKTLFGIAAATQQYELTVEYGNSLVDIGAGTSDTQMVIAQSYFFLKDCKDSLIWADKAIAAARQSGETPKENLFLFKLQCASYAGDTPAMVAALMDLIRLNNKTPYWNTLLRIERQDERDDHNTLMIYRIMYNTHSMNADTDYVEMAQLLDDAALPAEAATVLRKAISSGVVKDERMDRFTRLLATCEKQAESDRQNLQAEVAEANQSASGERLVKLGEVYYGLGEYQKGIDAIAQGLQKGSVQHMDEAIVYLGLAKVQLQNFADAKSVFGDIASLSNVSPRLSRLWRLYASTLPPIT